jgi:hypothetical protein
MSTGYQQLFRQMPNRKVPAGLADSVMLRIEAYEVRRLRIRAAAHGALVLVALVLCVPTLNYIVTAIAQSGFGQYLSVALSDSGYVAAHWKDFSMLLADSLPVTGSIALLAVAAVFTNSLRRMLGYIASLSAHNRRLV